MIKDKNVLELMKLDLTSKIRMTVNGVTNIYQFSDNANKNEDFELYAITDKRYVYGLSCNGIIEVVGVLIQDYANGIIADIEIIDESEE